MITTVDVETSWQVTSTGGYDPSAFDGVNILILFTGTYHQ